MRSAWQALAQRSHQWSIAAAPGRKLLRESPEPKKETLVRRAHHTGSLIVVVSLL